MAKRPALPLEEQAAIERMREEIFKHAWVTFTMLFDRNPPRTVWGISDQFLRPPSERKPATLKVQLREHASNLFDAEARFRANHSTNEPELRTWLDDLALSIIDEVMTEKRGRAPQLDWHCPSSEQSEAIREALSERRDHWIKKAQKAPEVPWSDEAVRVREQERTEQILRPVNSERAAHGDRGKDEAEPLPDIVQVRAVTEAEDAEPLDADEVARRLSLLEDYKAAASTGNPSNRRIYQAKNSGIHKPEFYEWRKGTLARESETSKNFERFLRDKKPPIPRKPRL